MAMTSYASKIDLLLAKMFSLKSLVLPANRNYLERYLSRIWTPVTELTTALRRTPGNEVLRAKFQPHVDAEEARLRRNLEAFRYDIDARDALMLITGPGRIEKVTRSTSRVFVEFLIVYVQFLLPLLYLLLKRDYEIMRIGRGHVLHKDELFDAADTFDWVFEAVQDRYNDLSGTFGVFTRVPCH